MSCCIDTFLRRMFPRVTTDAQWIANRLNALKSTGPRSPAGKRASAGNARTHGLSRPLDSSYECVRAVSDAIAIDLPIQFADQVALKIVELERAEQAAREAFAHDTSREMTLFDELTGISITAELLSQLPNHFSQSEIEELLGRATIREGLIDAKRVVQPIKSFERYLKRAANQVTRYLRQALDT